MIELNEAFAAQALAVIREFGFKMMMSARLTQMAVQLQLGHPSGMERYTVGDHRDERVKTPTRHNTHCAPCVWV